MTRNKRTDVTVFVGMVLTLALCVLSFILLDDLQRFEDEKYSGITLSSVMILDVLSPEESESYHEYKREFEFKSNQVTLYSVLSLLSLAFTVMIATSGHVTRPSGSASSDQDYDENVQREDA